MVDLSTIFWLCIINIILCLVFLSLALVIFLFRPSMLLPPNQVEKQPNIPIFKKTLNKDGRTMVLKNRLKPVYNDDSKCYRDERANLKE